jgi:hypothetical protein
MEFSMQSTGAMNRSWQLTLRKCLKQFVDATPWVCVCSFLQCKLTWNHCSPLSFFNRRCNKWAQIWMGVSNWPQEPGLNISLSLFFFP